MTEEKRKMKSFRLPEDLIEKFERQAKEENKTEQEYAIEIIKIGLDGRRKIPNKLRGMVEMKLGGPTPCGQCGKIIPKGQPALVNGDKPDEPPLCLTCCHQTGLDEIMDPIVLKNDLILQEQKEKIHMAAKLYRFLLKQDKWKLDHAESPEYGRLERETNEAMKTFCLSATNLLKEKFVTMPEKEWLITTMEELKKLKEERNQIKQKRLKIRLNPVSLKEIDKMSQIAENLDMPQIAELIKVGEVEDTEKLIYDPKAAEKIRDPNNKAFAEAGQVYCNSDGLWIDPKKCESCKEKDFVKYDNCQKQREKQNTI